MNVALPVTRRTRGATAGGSPRFVPLSTVTLICRSAGGVGRRPLRSRRAALAGATVDGGSNVRGSAERTAAGLPREEPAVPADSADSADADAAETTARPHPSAITRPASPTARLRNANVIPHTMPGCHPGCLSFDLPNGSIASIPTITAPTTSPTRADTTVLTTQPSTPPTPGTPWTPCSRMWTRW